MADLQKIATLMQAMQAQQPQQQTITNSMAPPMQVPKQRFLAGSRIRGTGDPAQDEFLSKAYWQYTNNWSKNYSALRNQNPSMSEDEIFAKIGPRPDRMSDPKMMMRYMTADANPMSEFEQKKELIKMQFEQNKEMFGMQKAQEIAMRDYNAALEKDKMAFTAGENRLNREAQTQENQMGRDFTIGQNRENRQWQASESEKDRAIRQQQLDLQLKDYNDNTKMRELQATKMQKEIDLMQDTSGKKAMSQITGSHIEMMIAYNQAVSSTAQELYKNMDAKTRGNRTVADFIPEAEKLLASFKPDAKTKLNIQGEVAAGNITQEEGDRLLVGLDMKPSPRAGEDANNNTDTSNLLKRIQYLENQIKKQGIPDAGRFQMTEEERRHKSPVSSARGALEAMLNHRYYGSNAAKKEGVRQLYVNSEGLQSSNPEAWEMLHEIENSDKPLTYWIKRLEQF